MYSICKKINLVLEHPINFCCKRLSGKAFATMSWRWVSESVTIYIPSMMHVKFMLVPMKAMPVALGRTKYVITGCLELWAEIKQIIIDIRSLLFTHSNTETGWRRLVARNCAPWKRALITAAWGLFVFQVCRIKVVHHCATKLCSERPLKAAKTWGQLCNQSLRVKEYSTI